MPCILMPHQCIRVGGVVISPTKLEHIKTDTYRAVASDLATLTDRLADLQTTERVNALPDRLEACWQRGESLMSDAHLSTPEARLDDLLAFMHSRTDNPWGAQMREATAAYLRGVVQHEVTPEQRARIRAEVSASPEP